MVYNGLKFLKFDGFSPLSCYMAHCDCGMGVLLGDTTPTIWAFFRTFAL